MCLSCFRRVSLEYLIKRSRGRFFVRARRRKLGQVFESVPVVFSYEEVGLYGGGVDGSDVEGAFVTFGVSGIDVAIA